MKVRKPKIQATITTNKQTRRKNDGLMRVEAPASVRRDAEVAPSGPPRP